MYESASDKLVWAALSETILSESGQALIKSYIGIMVESMVEHGLLGK